MRGYASEGPWVASHEIKSIRRAERLQLRVSAMVDVPDMGEGTSHTRRGV
jgi:hypothetical protein